MKFENIHSTKQTRMWANAQCDGRPAEYRWRPVFNTAKFGSHPLLKCRAVTLPKYESTRLGGCKWILHLAKFHYGPEPPRRESSWN